MSVKPVDWQDLPQLTVAGTPRLIEALRDPPTFEEYVAMCEGDGEPPPTREEYLAAVGTPAIGEIGGWSGVRFVSG